MRYGLFCAVLFVFTAGAVAGPPGKPVIGGLTNPKDNKTEVATPLPASQKKKNVGGRDGAGLCVFTSIEYCARYQNEPRLFDLQKNMTKEPGGGYPEKVDAMIKKYGNGTRYVQDTTGNVELLKLAIKTGRPCGVTYDGYDDHYGYGRPIAHMVQLVYIDNDYACISDNNYPADNQYVWMTTSEFVARWTGNGGGWCVILLNPPPPPPPTN